MGADRSREGYAPDRVARAPPRARVFGKDVEHVTSRRSPPDNAAFLPSPPISSLQGPLRTLSARTFETLLDETNVRENEVRTPRATDPLPSPPRDLAPPGRVAGRPPRARSRNLQHVAHFFPPSENEKTDPPPPSPPPLSLTRNGSRSRTSPRSRATCPRWTSWTTTPRRPRCPPSRRPPPASPSPPGP